MRIIILWTFNVHKLAYKKFELRANIYCDRCQYFCYFCCAKKVSDDEERVGSLLFWLVDWTHQTFTVIFVGDVLFVEHSNNIISSFFFSTTKQIHGTHVKTWLCKHFNIYTLFFSSMRNSCWWRRSWRAHQMYTLFFCCIPWKYSQKWISKTQKIINININYWRVYTPSVEFFGIDIKITWDVERICKINLLKWLWIVDINQAMPMRIMNKSIVSNQKKSLNKPTIAAKKREEQKMITKSSEINIKLNTCPNIVWFLGACPDSSFCSFSWKKKTKEHCDRSKGKIRLYCNLIFYSFVFLF